jgi:hypothetical protein
MEKITKLLLAVVVMVAVLSPLSSALGQYYNYNYNYNTNYANCADYAYKMCQGNSILWYNSCGNPQGIFQTCTANQICQNGQCVNIYIPPVNTYKAHFSIKCYTGNLFWYDNLGAVNTLYKSCNDNNSCTTDGCTTRKCSYVLKCDGTTCATGSADFTKYCSGNNNTINNPSAGNGLSVSFFAKTDASSTQWQKTVQVNANSQAYFMISIVNNTNAPIDNINVSANIPGQITTLGNLKIDGVPVSGDIISGISVGTITQGASKSITFEGKTQGFSSQATVQANAAAIVNGVNQLDSLSINFNPSQVTASVSSAKNASPFMDFLKRWYLWILVGLVLIFLFIVIFKRLSSNNE